MTSRWPNVTIEELVATPDHYLFAFEGERAVFAAMDREAYSRSIFLDRRIGPASPQMVAVPTGAVSSMIEGGTPADPQIGCIFHIAHCGSTLLARALDRPDDSLVLREPLALRQLGVERAQAAGPAGAGWTARLRLVIALARRRYRSDAPVVVKANVPVNFAMGDILSEAPAGPAICLYFPFRAYLLAILRSDDHRRWVMNVTRQLEPALHAIVGPLDPIGVPQRAAALWMAQMRLYADALQRVPGVRSLAAETLFGAPAQTVGAAAAHFGIHLPDAEADAIVSGPLFSTYSKSPDAAFDNARRLELQAESSRRLRPELDQARRWLDSRLESCPLPVMLGKPLVGASPLLLED